MHFLKSAMKLAEKGRGFVSPNPLVGAVLVRSGRIIAKGYHRKFGEAHAERNLLQSFKGKILSTDTLYSTLEPCCHHGKTPPCTDIILKRGIKHLVIGLPDPNPKVSGKGIALLKKAGVKIDWCEDLELLEKLKWQNRGYFTWMQKHRPWITLKVAQTLDGRITPDSGTKLWLSGNKASQESVRRRAEFDAILVGVKTVIVDNPNLTARGPRAKLLKAQPRVVILDCFLSTPLKSVVLRPGTIIIHSTSMKKRKTRLEQLQDKGVECFAVKSTGGYLNVQELIRRLTEKGITSILVEGGPHAWSSFLREDLVDEIVFFIAPKFLGDGVPTFEHLAWDIKKMQIRTVKRFGNDFSLQVLPES